jgi:hypothetical protein
MLGESNIHGIGRARPPKNAYGESTSTGGGGGGGGGDTAPFVPKPVQYWESPNQINPGLVWHQPHVVYMAELEYRAANGTAAKKEVLDRMHEVVFATAAFIADFPERRRGTGTNGTWLDLGPPLVSASEGEGPYDVWNPTYELTQFNFSLDVANSWLERMGKPRNTEWDDVRLQLAPLPITVFNGKRVYNRHQNCHPSVFSHNGTKHCSGPNSHPALTGALGCLPGLNYAVDREVMNNTLHAALEYWNWDRSWGWDQPMVALTATRLGLVETALETLFMNVSKNRYVPTGYNHPTNGGEIAAYLPGNGGTLIATGLMAGGWEGAPKREAPGFPPEWQVRAEGFTPYF